METDEIQKSIQGTSAYTPKLFAQFLPQLTAPTSSYTPVEVWVERGIIVASIQMVRLQSVSREDMLFAYL